MLKLLLFITIIISINCVADRMSSRSKIDLEKERTDFYKQAKPINRVKHAGNLPLLSASELNSTIYGLNQTINKVSLFTSNPKVYRELVSLKQQLMFRLKYKLYKPDNPNETNNVKMIRSTLVFD